VLLLPSTLLAEEMYKTELKWYAPL
jgi:hypothetical protein